MGGGISLADWWRTNCLYTDLVRIDILTQNNISLARYEPIENFGMIYSSGINFDFKLEIEADKLLNQSNTIDDEWLIELGSYLDGGGDISLTNLKANSVEYYDQMNIQLKDRFTNEDSVEVLMELDPSNLNFTYSGVAEKMTPDGTPKYFKIKTDQNRNVYTNEFNWSPEWMDGDTLRFTYSI